MSYLQIGAPKCGNFWLYQILQQILHKSGQPHSSFIEQQPIYQLAKDWELNFPDQARIDVLEITDLQCRYRISSIFKMPIDDMHEYVKQSNHTWTHSRYCPRSNEVLPLYNKKIYIIRDPRDRAISAARYFTSPYMLKYFPQPETDPRKFLASNFEFLMKEWVWHVFDYLRISKKFDIHIAFFEGFNLNFHEELQHLLDYLKVEFSSRQKRDIEEEVSFRELRKENPKHLQSGKSGYWHRHLSQQQAEWATAYTLPLLRFLGYSADQFQRPNLIDKKPHDFELLKQELIDAQPQFEPLPNS